MRNIHLTAVSTDVLEESPETLRARPADRVKGESPPPAASLPSQADLARLDGALGRMVDYTLATAIHPQPWLAVAAALAAVGTLMGRRYRTATNLRSNLYVVGVAASGAGKEHARTVIAQSFLAAGFDGHLGGGLVSGDGLLSALLCQPAMLFQIDLFGRFVENIIGRRGAPKRLVELWDLFAELWSGAGSTFSDAEYTRRNLIPHQGIVQPCCSIHATTTPDPFWQLLGDGSLEDSCLARFLVFETDVDFPDSNPSAEPLLDVPDALIEDLRTIAGGVPGSARMEPYTVPMTPDAEQVFEELKHDITNRQRRSIGTGLNTVLARVRENTTKVALIKAVSAKPLEPVIRLEDAIWARDVVAVCVETRLTQARRHSTTKAQRHSKTKARRHSKTKARR